jgi:hypothetical protein
MKARGKILAIESRAFGAVRYVARTAWLLCARRTDLSTVLFQVGCGAGARLSAVCVPRLRGEGDDLWPVRSRQRVLRERVRAVGTACIAASGGSTLSAYARGRT